MTAVTSSWIECAPMKCARSNFAMVGLTNFVYVFGGISGCGEGAEAHHPVLAQQIIERYQPKADVWDPINIATAPSLAAFAWTRLGSKPEDSKIVVFGGSNGDITL